MLLLDNFIYRFFLRFFHGFIHLVFLGGFAEEKAWMILLTLASAVFGILEGMLVRGLFTPSFFGLFQHLLFPGSFIAVADVVVWFLLLLFFFGENRGVAD